MHNEIITYYSKNPVNKEILDDYTVEYWEESRTCGDDLKVYIKIEAEKIKKWGFTGDTSMITTACASIFGESIIGKDIKEIFNFDYNYIEELIGSQVSEKRKQASVLGLLTTRNAIHSYIKDGKIDTFDDIIT